ncbi:2-keto-4-pentenoate hydratase/2-oxohepta-3-ene-1,7-dioic acid hydratase (catechol pathway) [Amycolatopsis arida]|uniref:2-keto-4-pentenoate hydratase/2-oxohepta-3-ene-1,7-dioic acid hydratase (Catechol pathway) n=1 Tax=Amycolatopsis arida TaxID=587909 RepID=A0A1I6AM74_9PSEU|nr:fumarylacetoacetate hydrolase family protein [Amycolatopsis arida]TDX87395.1 2-keto-4-pentenoate hydratase/2-oxohepta-3-ene-1,7-dioic acid hydratase in catechol pathway [Amycolatopsis arida]SFQ69739.1 2-keto-4-pentenoate hydratase/2-oxohepta-3-ene-1,7-dioic acid hydratase (catechol pathway) [Amycolatopsis arida]
MRFVTAEYRGAAVCGVLDGDEWCPIPGGATLLDLLRSGSLHLAGDRAARGGVRVPVDELRLLAPLEPPSIRDFVAFEEHVEGVRRSVDGAVGVPPEWYAAPAFYFSNPYAVTGPHDDIPVPPGCRVLDFELEVAAVIGRAGGDLTAERAREHIAGYTILNDWSARDLQARETKVGLGPAKGKDFATTLGPCLVTADELEPYRDGDGFLALDLRVSVNGVEVGQDLLANMGWPFEELVAHASRGTVVRPGDVLGSGTCGNGGCLAEWWGRHGEADPPPLEPGDVVEMTVEGIGTIRNRIVPGVDLPPVPAARVRPRDRDCRT